MKKYIIVFVAALLSFSCGDDSNSFRIDDNGLPAVAEFTQSALTVSESEKTLSITVFFDKPAPEEGEISIEINNISAQYNQDYRVSPEPSNDKITLEVSQYDTKVSFTVSLIDDGDLDAEEVGFTMVSATGGVRLANRNTLVLTISDEVFVADPKYSSCLDPLKNDELNVVTWNIEFFPMNGNTTINLVSEIIKNINADVIAVQEINSINDFNVLSGGLTGWESQVVNLSGSLDIGFLYKTSEVSIISNAKAILSGSVSPRPPVEITIEHTNGLQVTLLNIHLKCCGGQSNIDRRASASLAMKNYIDQNHPNDNVIVLGDFNDDINSDSPFINFIDDASNYMFADMSIATGSQSNWSYPSWPSHIDHILITNELVDNLVDTKTLTLNVCLSNYPTAVSDHRPVMATFK